MGVAAARAGVGVGRQRGRRGRRGEAGEEVQWVVCMSRRCLRRGREALVGLKARKEVQRVDVREGEGQAGTVD